MGLSLVLVVALFLGWMWMRSEVLRRGGWRVGAGLLAVVLVVAGAVLSIKGDWIIGLPMVLIALLSAAGGRINRRSFAGGRAETRRSPPAPAETMSEAQARSLLGLEFGASPVEVRAAHKRLMQMAHPDKGGTAGLAAQLNAARDRLLKV
jgi:hypothetical protein